MLPVTGCPFGMSGKSLENTGLNRRAIAFTMPPFSPIFITPSQNASTPVSPKEISNAVLEDSNTEFIMAGNTVVSPITVSFTKAITKAMMKKAIQM